LAGGIAHDFNNSLNIIRGYAMLAGTQHAQQAQVAESMKVINEEVDRGAAIVRQLLTLARKTDTRLTDTDLNQIVVRVGELIKQTFPKTISIKLRLDHTIAPVLADSNQINQALLNICVNARDAMPTGGDLTLRTSINDGSSLQKRHPETSASPYVCLAVSDTGTGIEESIRSRIFEPFFTTKGFGEGTGLGLAMVYGIIKSHKGIVDVESESGHGTTVRLFLPLDQDDNDAVLDKTADRKSPAREITPNRATVLVVEDEPAMAHLLAASLRQEGYNVLAAFDGAEAIDLYERHGHEVDLVLMDLGLPKISGSEVIRRMKEHNPGVKVIVTTGYLEPALKSELLSAEVKDYIYKPYSLDIVLAKVETLSGHSTLAAPLTEPNVA
jgi:CheY-like chemotaxis protein